MSTSDSANRSSISAKPRTRNFFDLTGDRTTHDIVDEYCQELPPIELGEIIANRYVIIRPLGRGGFSDVYVALDHELNRQVALKRLLIEGINPQHMKNEAKVLASLDHPNIVRIFDICEDSAKGYFIVMQYISGPTLRELMQKELSIQRVVEIAVRVCGALIHAHSRGVVHRDIKPTNILISTYGEPLVTDFGLATAPSTSLNPSYWGGTPRYMSPEQIRQETNRIGPSSDIFSTGVVLYEMLSGKLPFGGTTPDMIAEATLNQAPVSLTTLSPDIPEEVDRICRRALRKNVRDRYGSMEAFQADLIRWSATLKETTESVQWKESETQYFYDSAHSTSAHSQSNEEVNLGQFVVRGLQPFEEQDSAIYIPLIPGAIAPSGLPESLQFWKQWLEGFENDSYSRVGILYGPSGSGKTSFVRAGILPHLSPEVLPILVSCRPGDLGAQIASAISAAVEWTPHDDLISMLMKLRQSHAWRRERRKVVLLLDQFDAWSTPATAEELNFIAAALRHCDGESLQALIVIRDDSWVPITEFLHMVECGVEQWKNARAIDLLDRHHVRKLLEAVGRDYGSLPALPVPLSLQQSEFLDRAIAQLVTKNRIVPIQLAIFVKMAKQLPWQTETLTSAGETQGLFVNFFQDLFEGTFSPPMYRRVQAGVAEILQRLLPNADQTVRDVSVSATDLEQALVQSGLQTQFHRSLQILIEDLRLVVRVPAPHAVQVEGVVGRRTIHYQLAHDFLVEPVRLWIDQVCKNGWRGRVRARMEELSAIWSRRREQRYLPTLSEFIEMKVAVPAKRLTPLQRSYLAAATRMQVSVCSIALIILLSIASIGWFGYQQFHQSHALRIENVASKIDSALHGESGFFLFTLGKLQDEPQWVEQGTKQWILSEDSRIRTRAKILAVNASPGNFESLALDLADIEPELSQPVIELATQCRNSTDLMHKLYASSPAVNTTKVRAAITLAYLGDTGLLTELLSFTEDADANDTALFEALNWKGSSQLWVELLEQNRGNAKSNPGVLYHALGLLASYEMSEVTGNLPWEYIENLCDDDNPAIQNTARWFLKQMNRPLARKPKANAARCELAAGPSFVRVPRGQLELAHPILQPGSGRAAKDLCIDQAFWISSAAITNEQFERFLHDTVGFREKHGFRQPAGSDRSTQVDLPRNQPVTGYPLEYLLAYCNWLSEKAGLEAAYELIEEDRAEGEAPKFKPLPSNGFRLPTAVEFTFAFSAHASEVKLRGVPVAIKNKTLPSVALETFSSYLKSSDAVDDFMPNRFGIHFMEYAYLNLVTEENQLYNHVISNLDTFDQFLLVKAELITPLNSFYVVQGNSGLQEETSWISSEIAGGPAATK